MGSRETQPAPGVASWGRSHTEDIMDQDQSNGGGPEREETQVDFGPIQETYNAATKVIKLGRRWLSTRPDPDTFAGNVHLDKASYLFTTFADTFREELFGFRNRYLSSRSMQTLISNNPPLSTALQYLEDVCGRVFQAVYCPPCGEVVAKLEELETAWNILGEVLDDLEAQENPTLQPVWDRGAKQLWYGEILCREYRKTAPEQFQILDLFQVREWPRTVPSPWRDEKKMRDTVGHLNDNHTNESLIRFEVFNMRPAWLRFRPRSESR